MTRHPVDQLGTLPGSGLRPSPVVLAGLCPREAVVYPRTEAGNALPAVRRGTRGFAAKGGRALAGEWRMDGSQGDLDWTGRRADLRRRGGPLGP
jgi:hypothetical protein